MISRVLKRLASALDYAMTRDRPLENHYLATTLNEQFAYGHREILLTAAGIQSNNLLWGSVPHAGWGRPPEGVLTPRAKRDPYGRELSQWFWNREWQETARQNGASRVYSIGAPWLYLLRQLNVRTIWEQKDKLGSPRHAKYLLFVPMHSWEGMMAQIAPDLERLKSLSCGQPIRILLSWGDFLNRELRQHLALANVEIDCVGYRSSPFFWPWSPLGDRIVFLRNLVSVLQHASLVVSDVPSTALIYAASLGIPVHVEPDLGSTHTLNALDAQHMRRLLAEYAWMQDSHAAVYDHRWDIARDLGFDSLLSAVELRRTLTWRTFQH